MIARTIETHTLSNGLTVIAAEVPDTAAFSLAMHILAGSRDESPETNGAFHFLEHMMFRGTERYGNSIALAHALESLGGDNNATTDAEMTSYWLEGHADRLVDGFDLFQEFFFNPTFVDMEIERSILLQELAEDCSEDGSLIETYSLAQRALFPNHPLGLPIIGTAETITRMDRETLIKLRNKHYRPDSSVLVISSPMKIEKMVRLAESHFVSAWKRPKVKTPSRLSPPQLLPPRSNRKPRREAAVVTQDHSDSQFDFRLMLPAHGGLSERVVAQQFLERVLDDGIASRLTSSLRERLGLAYDVSCEVDAFSDTGICTVAATMATESLPLFLKTLSDEFQRLQNEPPTLKEMERIRSRYLLSARTLPEDLPGYLSFLVWRTFLGSTLTLKDEIEVVQGLQMGDVETVARDLLGAQRRVGVLVGPHSRRHGAALERFLESLGD